ncbi:helix-turn-helix domain-containing protein [Coprobacter sp.]|uniref:helix-turn-helix domain-containing protein n=1 Tax=Coprobacter sp. TaxID=1941478 RepID=UPI003AB57840
MENKFAERLQYSIERNGIHVTSLAKRLKMSPNSVYAYVRGEVYPRLDIVLKLAEELRVSPAWLSGFDSVYQSTDTGGVNLNLQGVRSQKIIKIGDQNNTKNINPDGYSDNTSLETEVKYLKEISSFKDEMINMLKEKIKSLENKANL